MFGQHASPGPTGFSSLARRLTTWRATCGCSAEAFARLKCDDGATHCATLAVRPFRRNRQTVRTSPLHDARDSAWSAIPLLNPVTTVHRPRRSMFTGVNIFTDH
jgi:hypothetical protein